MLASYYLGGLVIEAGTLRRRAIAGSVAELFSRWNNGDARTS
jgi:hypothetical protein